MLYYLKQAVLYKSDSYGGYGMGVIRGTGEYIDCTTPHQY